MKPAALLPLLVLMLPLMARADRVDHERARQLVERGEIQPLGVILERARAEVPGRVLEVELERKGGRWLYELEILDEQGREWELRLDAGSGRLLQRTRED